MSSMNYFEIERQIQIFASLCGTDGVSDEVKKTANEYLDRLIKTMGGLVSETILKTSGVTLLKAE